MIQRMNFLRYLFSIPLLSGGIFLFHFTANATSATPTAKIISTSGGVIKQLDSLHDLISRGAYVATGDLGGDGIDEIIVSSGKGSEPRIYLFRQDGSKIGSFLAYGKTFHGGVNVASGDVDGDGLDDVITAPMGGGGPQVRIFDRYGAEKGYLWPYEKTFRGGVSLTTANTDGVTGDELVVGRQSAGNSEIRVYEKGKNIAYSFMAFAPAFRGGVNVSGADIDGDGIDEIVAAPASSGGPQIRIFQSEGKVISSKFIYENSFRGGLRVSAIDADDGTAGDEVIVSPLAQRGAGSKRIDIDISEQVMRLYEGSVQVGEHRVSTGTWSMPTPIGTFQVRNHISTAYSKRYALYMDWWMAITPDGAYGLHSLPYWKTKNGIIYEGRDHIGKRVSHGCVRQLPAESKALYDWAPNGTSVTVHQ